jgi:protein-disulfide isomerase/cyclophilin family peptidyl-prolyl cis-trans isomerase
MSMSKARQTVAIFFLLIVALFVSACGPAVTEEPTPTPTLEETEEPTPAPTDEEPEIVESEPIPGVCEVSPFPALDVPPVDEGDWVKGAEDAEITIFEYSDFECPGCAAMAPVLEQFLEEHPNVRLVYRHFPLSFHEKAMVTAEATEAAGAQGAFWEMHDLIFGRRDEWASLTPEEAEEQMVAYAEELDLDIEQFRTALEEDTYVPDIEADLQAARELGLPGTPSFIFNDVLFPTDQLGLSYSGLESFLDILDLRERQYADAPPTVIETDKEYQATISTTAGDIVVELLPEEAPVQVNNFVFLAEEGWYADTEFFFVQDGFAALAGDVTNTGIGYPGYYCTGESSGVFDGAGLVGMLPNGQFFLTLGDQAAQLNNQFPLIGRIVEGQDVLDALNSRAPNQPGGDAESDIVESVTVEEL